MARREIGADRCVTASQQLCLQFAGSGAYEATLIVARTIDLAIALEPTMLVQVEQHPPELMVRELARKSGSAKRVRIEQGHLAARFIVCRHQPQSG